MSDTATTPTPAAATPPPATPAKAADAAPPPPRTKVYTTKQVVDGVRVNLGKPHAARVANGGPPTPPATEMAVAKPAEPAAEVPAPAAPTEPPPVASSEPPPAAGEGTDNKPAEVARETAATPAAEPEKLTDSELAKRLAKISRAEAKVEERERQNSGKIALADAFTHALPGVQLTPENVHQALSRVAMIEQVRQGRGVQSKLQLIQQVFGWDFASLADEAVAETGKKPEQRALEQAASTTSELAALREEMRQDRQRRQTEDANRQMQGYIDTTVAGAIADKAKFPLLHGKLGANAAREVYNIQAEHWRRHQQGLSPQAAAEALEKHLRSQAESDAKLLGLSAPAPVTDKPKRTEPATNGQAQKPPVVKPAAPKTVRPRETSRPYSTSQRAR